jgi:formyl-CoA transferase
MRLLTFKDGFGTASPVTDSQFHGFCKAFGVEATDQRFATVADRNANASELIDIMRAASARAQDMTAAEAMAALEAEDVPCAQAQKLQDLPDHPQLQANDTFGRITNPQAGTMCEPNNPPNFSATPSDPLQPAAQLGEHTEEVLRELGKTDADIAALCEAGVVAQGSRTQFGMA